MIFNFFTYSFTFAPPHSSPPRDLLAIPTTGQSPPHLHPIPAVGVHYISAQQVVVAQHHLRQVPLREILDRFTDRGVSLDASPVDCFITATLPARHSGRPCSGRSVRRSVRRSVATMVWCRERCWTWLTAVAVAAQLMDVSSLVGVRKFAHQINEDNDTTATST